MSKPKPRECDHRGVAANKVCPKCGVRVRGGAPAEATADGETVEVEYASARATLEAEAEAPETVDAGGPKTIDEAPSIDTKTIDERPHDLDTKTIDEAPPPPSRGLDTKTIDEQPPSSAPPSSGAFDKTVQESPPSSSSSVSPFDRTVTESQGSGGVGAFDKTVQDSSPPSSGSARPPSTKPSRGGSDVSSLHMSHIESGKDVAGKLFDRGRYEILKEIARGGMGVVYKARQRELNRVVALKVMLSGAHASEEEKSRFKREAEASARLKHPNIVPVYDIGEEQGNLYFTMDFVEGAPLSSKKKDYDRKKLLDVMIKICDGVAYAHMRGIIHRDLKPANVMMDKNDEPLIMDFGLAKQTAETDEEGKQQVSGKTREGAVMGTPHYMPPEQAMGLISEIDVRTDVYALGVILYELWCGRLPFNAPSFGMLLQMISEIEPTPPRTIDPSVPWEVEAVALKAMEKEKSKRYDTALDMKRDLERFRDGEAILAKKATLVYRARRWAYRNRIAIGLGAVVAVALGGAAVVTARQMTAGARARAQELQDKIDRAVATGEAARRAVHAFEDETSKLEKTALGAARLATARALLKSRPSILDRVAALKAESGEILTKDAESAKGKELDSDAKDLSKLLGGASDRLDRVISDEVAAQEKRAALAQKIAAARAARDEAAKQGATDEALATLAGGYKNALAAVALGGGDDAEALVKELGDASNAIKNAMENKKAHDAAAKALQDGKAALASAGAESRAGRLDKAIDAAQDAVDLSRRALFFEFKPDAETTLRDARVLKTRALMAKKDFRLALEEIRSLAKEENKADKDAAAALQREISEKQGEVQRNDERIAKASAAVAAARDAGTYDAANQAEEEIDSIRKLALTPEQRAKADELKARAAHLKAMALARDAEAKAAAFKDLAKPEVASGLWDDAAKAFAKAESEEDVRRCRLALGAFHLASADAQKAIDPRAALGEAKLAVATFEELKAEARLKEARALRDDLARLTGRPEGMILWRGMTKVQLGGGPEDRNLVRIVEEVKPFYIAERETTNQEFYDQFVAKRGYARAELWRDGRSGAEWKDKSGASGPAFWQNGKFPDGDGALPVVGISWYEARAFARAVGKRLPRDAEWEACARLDPGDGAVKRIFPWGEWSAAASEVFGHDRPYDGPRAIGPQGACARDCSPIGCFDMGGNVSEWVDFDVDANDKIDPSSLAPEDLARVLRDDRGSVRGGSFLTPFETLARATHRFLPKKSLRSPCVGVRLAREISGGEK